MSHVFQQDGTFAASEVSASGDLMIVELGFVETVPRILLDVQVATLKLSKVGSNTRNAAVISEETAICIFDAGLRGLLSVV